MTCVLTMVVAAHGLFVLSLIILKHKKCVLGPLRYAHGHWSIFLIGLLPKNKYNYGMMTIIIETMIDLLNGIMVIKNARSKK